MIIPFDLFPRRKAQINTKWGTDTYKYYSMFNQDVMISEKPTKDEVIEWLLFSKELFDCIKQKAQERIMKEIVLVANRYQLQTLKKTKIISFEDILRLYMNKQWYCSKLQNNRDYLYIFQYGLLRSGTDMWVDDVVEEFIFKKYNVVYEKIKVKGKKKGCFHKLVLNSAGDYISSRLQRVCMKYLGEYVCSRCPKNIIKQEKDSDKKNHKSVSAIPHIFLSYHKGYIVKQGSELTAMGNVDLLVKQLVEASKGLSITLDQLQEKIDDKWNGIGTSFTNIIFPIHAVFILTFRFVFRYICVI